jgi:hypothetical protein
MIAAAVVALSACGGASPPASAPVPPSRTAPVPAASVQPSPDRSPALGGTCALGYEDGSHTFPDTPGGLAAAQTASGGLEPHMALHVSITNTGSLADHLHALGIEFDDPAIPETITTPFNVRASLAPGASWDHWQDMGTPDKPEPLAGGIALHPASESVLQLFTCRILGWR